ncbi:hypothetical protein [Actinopolymorpha pittospori]|uniref:Uncharacterized protein n=1 Tax=Actinopolymorpha pittospori TaxID=648752 RepID=A0A927MVR8_9ACTN|nr:hypothetical protein [Actinopolymorpha pittospori]MBE1605698.1 hypothetical protein [Actinopolymorpha pittospori]
MEALLGDKHKFAAEIGDWVSPNLCRVDLWAADQWLTCDDNTVFVRQFRSSVSDTAAWVRSGQGSPPPFAGLPVAATHRRLLAGFAIDPEEDDGLREEFWILQWGPTTDNISALGFRQGTRLAITFQFWREEHLVKHPEHAGTVFEIDMEVAEFATTLDDLAAVLDRGQACV